MKKYFWIILLLFSNPIFSQEWSYRPIEGTQVSIKKVTKASDEKLIFQRDNKDIIEFNSHTGEIVNLFSSSTNNNLTVDGFGNIWTLDFIPKLYNIKTGETSAKDSLFPPCQEDDWWKKQKYWNIAEGQDNTILIYREGGIEIYSLSNDSYRYDTIPKYNGEYLQICGMPVHSEQYTVYYCCYPEQSLVFIDLENQEDISVYPIPEEIIDEELSINKILFTESGVYLQMSQIVPLLTFPEYSYLYKFNNGEFQKINIEYIENLECESFFIGEIIGTPKGNIAMTLRVYRDNTGWSHEFIIVSPDGELLFNDDLPYITADLATSNFLGEDRQFAFPQSLVLLDSSIYMAPLGDHAGILELNLNGTSGIEAETERYKVPQSWIRNIYPNPAEGSVTLDFCCALNEKANMKLEIYDYLGRRYEGMTYEIIEYDGSRGTGKIKVNIASIPAGPKYLMLKTSEDSHTLGIMVK